MKSFFAGGLLLMMFTAITGWLILLAFTAYCVFAVMTIIYVARFNLHMLQQNGYKNNEQRAWLKKNRKKESVLFVWLILSLAALVGVRGGGLRTVVFILIAVLNAVLLGFILYYYRFLKRYHVKRPLVFTARVKRLIASDAILTIAVFTAVVLLIPYEIIDVMIALPVAAVFQLISFIAANIINHPLEAAINRHYTNDALRRLASVRDHMTVIGITGSYGKTSMKYYLDELLSVKYNVLKTPGNFNTPLGVVRTVREHLNPSHEIFLCEMGARYVGDIKELCELAKPDIGIIVSVGAQHLETFGGMENVIATKFELADYIDGNLFTEKERKLFLNDDSSYMIEENKKHEGAVLYTASGKKDGHYFASDIKSDRHGTTFTATSPDGESEHFETHLLGEHNVINLIGAIAVAHELGIPLRDLKVPIRRLRPVEHRLQLKETAGATIIDDAYNSNPIGSKAAVEVLGAMDGTRILITPGMVELGKDEDEYNYRLGTYAAANCDYVALVGGRRADPIKKGLIDSGFDTTRIARFSRIEEALNYAYGIHTAKHRVILLENDLTDNY